MSGTLYIQAYAYTNLSPLGQYVVEPGPITGSIKVKTIGAISKSPKHTKKQVHRVGPFDQLE